MPDDRRSGAFIAPAVLAELTGTPVRDLQVKWLQENRWPFALDRFGKPKVAQAYFDRRLVGVEVATVIGETEPDWSSLGG